MNDAVFVGFFEGVSNLRAESGHFFFGETRVGKALGHGIPGDEFHNQKILALLSVEIVDGGNVGMIELGEREGFFAEKLTSMVVESGAVADDLDGNFAVEVLVASAVDNTHAAGANFLDDEVMT